MPSFQTVSEREPTCQLLFGARQTDEAIEQYPKIIELKPSGFDLAGVHNELGLLYINQGRKQDAIKEWQTALSIDPNNQRAKDLLGQYR